MDEKNTQKSKPKKKGMNGSKVAILALSIMLGLSLAVGVTAAYFTATQSATGNITLGNPVDIAISQGGTNVTELQFVGPAYPGTIYKQKIAITTAADTTDACVRAKLTLTNTDSASFPVTATTENTWVKGDDNYYYYNGTMTASKTVDFITSITVPTNLTNDDAKKIYAVSVIAEAIQSANGAPGAVWTTAPTEWLETYGGTATPIKLAVKKIINTKTGNKDAVTTVVEKDNMTKVENKTDMNKTENVKVA